MELKTSKSPDYSKCDKCRLYVELITPQVGFRLRKQPNNSGWILKGKCKTPNLGDHPRDDLELGALDLYNGKFLGDCNLLQASSILAATIFHEDTDGWRGDYVKILSWKCSMSIGNSRRISGWQITSNNALFLNRYEIQSVSLILELFCFLQYCNRHLNFENRLGP